MSESKMIVIAVILTIIAFIIGLFMGIYEDDQTMKENTQPQTYQIRTEAIQPLPFIFARILHFL